MEKKHSIVHINHNSNSLLNRYDATTTVIYVYGNPYEYNVIIFIIYRRYTYYKSRKRKSNYIHARWRNALINIIDDGRTFFQRTWIQTILQFHYLYVEYKVIGRSIPRLGVWISRISRAIITVVAKFTLDHGVREILIIERNIIISCSWHCSMI